MAKIRKMASVENGLMEVIKILSEEENFIVVSDGREFSEAFQETVSGRCCDVERQSLEHILFHRKHFSSRELVFGNTQQILKIRRVDLFVLS